MQVLEFVPLLNSAKSGISVDRSAIALGTYPKQVIIPVINLPEGARRVKRAEPYLVDDRLVLKVLDEKEPDSSEFCIVRMVGVHGRNDVSLEEMFPPETGIVIFASTFTTGIDPYGSYDAICKTPLNRVINYRINNTDRRFLIESDGTMKFDGAIGDLISPEEMENLSRAIDEGTATPA
jgi:hypothetical protein